MPHARIPNTNEKHSFFIDLKSMDASEEEVLAALTLDGIVGAHSRDDLWVVELICKDDTVVEQAMTTPFLIEGKKPVEAIWPRHKTNKHSVIKIANVPIGNRQELSEKLSHYWSQYGTVIDAAPYMFPGKPWLTKRWDVLLQLNEGVKKLDAPPVFQIDGYTDTMVCSWVGAKKACLWCKSAGHSTSKCPMNKPKTQKVGEMANPLQKIDGSDKSQKRQKKGSEVLPGNTEKSKASTSASASATQSATSALPATVATSITAPSSNFTVTVPLPTFKSMSEDTAPGSISFLGSELQQPRPTTPPNMFPILPDQDTPRKGRKRCAKGDEWMPTVEEMIRYMDTQRICRRCFGGHSASKCGGSERLMSVDDIIMHLTFKPHLERWILGRKKKGKTWRIDEHVLQICDQCDELGHMEGDCPYGEMEE